MRAQPDRSQTAEIVDMVSLLEATGRRRDSFAEPAPRTATLLSIRQSLRYQASIGLDDLQALQQRCHGDELDTLLGQVRQLLNSEFGSLRVHRYRQGFGVGHHELDSLVAGLLRVQYHARQLPMPASVADETALVTSVPALGWGVGPTLFEADNERLRRRQPKR